MSKSRSTLALVGWLVFCFAASSTAVFVSTAGWYDALRKPAWNPPAWIFGPVWTLLYGMMAVSAWLVWRQGQGGWKAQGRPLRLFLVQWLFNLLWTPLFFGMHWPGIAFADIAVLWFVIIATLAAFWKVNHAAALLLLPYLGWVSFASVLNFTIWRLNS